MEAQTEQNLFCQSTHLSQITRRTQLWTIYTLCLLHHPLPFPQFEEFNRLVNAEYRLRIEKRIKYEILEVVRNRLATSTEKWKARVARLDKFFDGVDEIANEVDTIQAEGYAKGSTHDNNILDESESEDEEERDRLERDRLERDRQSLEDREASEERLDDDDEGNEGLEDANIEEEHEAVQTNGGTEVADVEAENQEPISEKTPEQVDPESIAHDDLDDAMIID